MGWRNGQPTASQPHPPAFYSGHVFHSPIESFVTDTTLNGRAGPLLSAPQVDKETVHLRGPAASFPALFFANRLCVARLFDRIRHVVATAASFRRIAKDGSGYS